MKWTDNVVRLLIAIVACVGDDGTLESGEGLKRKSGILQKKGKWKTVSKIMISKGCHVSPQQCEDKFNDLNKRGYLIAMISISKVILYLLGGAQKTIMDPMKKRLKKTMIPRMMN
ncbi:unnamed protein product [Prunus armeniaca]|uniref:Myb/SANT-like DNA-binding domain-containing protein n=1 Tax=Prunus armeniaca TaxID=36596 RepID=A0A6J5UR24_PRUAR|nr:unnamed protein product [Prunus armeniaca]